MRQNEMQQLKDVLQQQFLAEQTNFNNLLNRDNDVTVNVVDSLMIPLYQPLKWSDEVIVKKL